MGAVQLQHVEAAALAALGRGDELRLDAVHRGAVHLARHLAVGEIGQRRRRHRVPAALLQRPVHAVPHQLGRALAAGVAELQADLRRRIGVDEIDDARPRRLLLVVPQAGAARRDPGVAADAGHLGEDQPGAADRARAVMHQMEIAGHALLRRIHAHRRHHRAVGHLHLAQPQRLEHRRHRACRYRRRSRWRGPACANALSTSRDEIRRAQRQIVVGDRLGAGHDAEGELHGIEIPEAVDMLEPDQRHVGGVLGLLDLLAPAVLVGLQARHRPSARCAIASASAIASSIASLVPEPIEKCAVALASPSSTMLSLTQRLLRIIGKLRHIERLVSSGWPSRNQPKISAIRSADCCSLRPFEPGALERLGIGLENPGRAADFILIGVGDERPPLGLLEDEGEGVERPGRAHPGELVGAQVDLGLEMIDMLLAEAAVDAVGQHDQIGIGKARLVVDIGFEHAASTPSSRARSCRISSSVRREQPQKPLPPTRCTVPRKCTAMSSQ